MKKVIFFMAFGILSFSQVTNAQICNAITAQVLPMSPQPSGENYDYYGVRVNSNVPAATEVYVQGYIHDEASISHGIPFQLTISPGNMEAQTATDFFQIERGTNVVVTIASVFPWPTDEITVTYAGVTITYETSNHILRFNSASDFNTVVDQLETDYDVYNDNYDAQYSNLTPEQMDDMDVANNFDEFAPYKNFENLFFGFASKRSEIENVESIWLNSGFTTTDPDDIDLTFDDAMNTVFNSDNAFKIGSDTYQLTPYGLYINGAIQVSVKKPFHTEAAFASYKDDSEIYSNALYQNFKNNTFGPTCKTNKKDKADFPFGNNKYKFKVALTSVSIRSTVKSKVKHFSQKNGSWKHSRAEMAVFIGGRTLNPLCNEVASFSTRKPSPNGWKKRRQLKVLLRDTTIIWKANSGDIVGSFDTAIGNSGGIPLTW